MAFDDVDNPSDHLPLILNIELQGVVKDTIGLDVPLLWKQLYLLRLALQPFIIINKTWILYQTVLLSPCEYSAQYKCSLRIVQWLIVYIQILQTFV